MSDTDLPDPADEKHRLRERVEELEAEVERLQRTLKRIAYGDDTPRQMSNLARIALKDGGESDA